MDLTLKQRFLDSWYDYFNDPELPITFYYTDTEIEGAELLEPPSGHQCVIGVLSKVRSGKSLILNEESLGCGGGKRYLGFTQQLRPHFEYFLSHGIPGEMEGERYKKSPELVKEILRLLPPFEAPGRYIVFKRWDMLEEGDDPDVVIFFATPDVLAGLFTLANFDEAEQNGVIAPFSSGCGSIVHYPFLERTADRPRAVLGMFDVSARPFVPSERLTFSVPINKFGSMVNNMAESFLITGSWDKVKRRIIR